MIACCEGDWKLTRAPIRVLGDDISGPHSTAIIIGKIAVVGCAHSLLLVEDTAFRTTKTTKYKKYLEEYWIQTDVTRNSKGEVTADNRIPIRLYKFNPDNDWALFVRDDDKSFEESEIATIDRSPLTALDAPLVFRDAAVLHCPVSLFAGIEKANEFKVGCNLSAVHIQNESSHHIKYEGQNLVRGSSGGGVFIKPNNSVLGIHMECINEVDFDADDSVKSITAKTDKRVSSEDNPYAPIDKDSNEQPPKRLKSESETVASLAGGNNGFGSALIICKYARLLHYIDTLNQSK